MHFLLTGCLFFWPVVGLDILRRRVSHPARLLMVFLAIPFHGWVGVALSGSATVGAQSHPCRPADRRRILVGSGDLVAIVAMLVVVGQWMEADRRQADREDRRLITSECDTPTNDT